MSTLLHENDQPFCEKAFDNFDSRFKCKFVPYNKCAFLTKVNMTRSYKVEELTLGIFNSFPMIGQRTNKLETNSQELGNNERLTLVKQTTIHVENGICARERNQI